MAQDYLRDELAKIYKQLFKEIEEFKVKVKGVISYSKNSPQNIVSKTNNPDTIVSVVTPAYNAEKFFPKLYQSLKKQSIAKQVEWVIVDDCSKDNVMEFYERLNNDNVLGKINVFRNEVNLGAGMSLKRGFSLASSKILAWVSADDFYMSEDKLEKDLQLLNSGLDIVFSKYTFLGNDIQGSKKVSVPSKRYRDKYHVFADILVSNYLNGSSVCMKKDTYLEIGGINEFLINVDGDLDLWVKSILLDKRIGFSDTAVFNHQHPGQTSRAPARMIVGKNITRLSYIRFLRQLMEHKKIGDYFEIVIGGENYRSSLKNFLVFVLLRSGFLSHFNLNIELIKRATNYFLIEFFTKSIWLEELASKEHYTEVFKTFIKFLSSKYHDLFQMHEFFKSQIYELSDEFMKTEAFEVFAKKYRNKH